MKLNFLYLLGPLNLSRWQNNELKYSLRSIDAAWDCGWVGITGPERPSFLTNPDLKHVKVEILPAFSRYKNMQRQLIAAMELDDTPEDLILMNDDFIVRSTPAWDWTPTYTGMIAPKAGKISAWKQTVLDTGNWLKARGVNAPICYEGHTPMPLKKSLALPVLKEILAYGKPLQFRSAYGNVVGIGGQLHPNAKRGDPEKWPSNTPFWSLKGNLTDKAKTFLETWLIKPSRWEASNEMATGE